MVRRNQPLLGTFVTISAYGPDLSLVQKAVSQAFDEIRAVDERMSVHRPASEISHVNGRAARETVEISPELFQVLAKASEIAHVTSGAFDITIRPLADLWGFIWKEYRLPTERELSEVLPCVNYRWVELDAQRRTVRFLREGMSIDLGGIAKGYAVDRAIDRLCSAGVTNAMVKAGGDLRVIGAPPGQTAWEVQLEDPQKQGDRVALRLRDRALSTSGNYENFFVVNGRRYSHILDPRSGFPVENIAACTVIANTCMESDAWATACFVLGPERSIKLLGEKFPMRFLVLGRNGVNMQRMQTRSFPELQNELKPGY